MPVDYLSGLGKLPDPMGDINRVINMRLGQDQARLQNQQLQAEMTVAQEKAARVKMFETDAANALTNPTPGAISNLIIAHPEYADQIKKGWDIKDGAAKQTDLTQLGEIYSAGSAGKFDLAAKAARRRLEADKAAGQADEGDEQLVAELESGDPARQKAALGMIGVHLAAATGPEHFGSVYGALNKGGEAFTLDAGAIRYAADGTVIAKSPYIKAADGTVFEADGTGGGSGTPASTPAANGSAPRSIRNNNPGNLRASPWTQKLPGYSGADSAGYAIFASPEAGNQAQATLLGGKGYYDGGRKTVASIIEKWAPRASKGGDNTDEQVNNYIGYVARKLGVNPNDTLARPLLPQMAAAMAEFESGRTGGAGATRTAPAAPAGNAPPGYHQLTAGKEDVPSGYRRAANGNLEAIPGGPADKPNGGSAKRMTPAEVAAEGLDPKLVYYRNENGVPTPVGGQDTKAAALPKVPAPVITAYTGNLSSVRKIDDALAQVKKNPSAVGGWNYVTPDKVAQWWDPKGVEARAGVSDVGSLLIHDRSGAAVTIAETPRLLPFVPQKTDDAPTVRKKLVRLRTELAAMNQDLVDLYSDENGDSQLLRIGQRRGAGGAVKVRSIQEAMKLAPGTLFTTPDGRTLKRR